MNFAWTKEQHAFAETLDALLSSAGPVAAARSWALGASDAGLALWRALADVGVQALCVPERLGGLDAGPVEATIAFEKLGYHGVPGPWIESVVMAPALLAGTSEETLLTQVAAGEALVSFAAPPMTPRAVDAAGARVFFLGEGGALHQGVTGPLAASVDPSRRLFEVTPGAPVATVSSDQMARAFDGAALACAAVLLGAGERMLATSVDYVGERRQFGRPVGQFQAVKHLLADVRVALDFARPLVLGAAHQLAAGSSDAGRDVSAAKVACADAAHLAARTALQVHGAIAYTLECDVSLWFLKVRALLAAWGTAGFHRDRLIRALI
jgi:alkylation response protein AidB-like acyl-CoA dehydrogenase